MDFSSLSSELLARSEACCIEWFPLGRRRGHEYLVGDLAGTAGESLSVNLDTGRWSDFATGAAGGDLIALYAGIHGIAQGEALKRLSNGHGDSSGHGDSKTAHVEWTPIVPVPEDAPQPPDEHYQRIQSEWVKLKFIRRWTYTDAQGRVVGHVCRFERYDNGVVRKDVIPQTWCQGTDGKREWKFRAIPKPRPLYHLADLLARPSAPVLIVEGEKCADAVREIMPQYVGIAWAGGAAAWRNTDFTPLRGRKHVLLWPDLDRANDANGHLLPSDDQPGLKAMMEIGHQLQSFDIKDIKIIIPTGDDLPDGFDIADAVDLKWTWERAKDWMTPRVQPIGQAIATIEKIAKPVPTPTTPIKWRQLDLVVNSSKIPIANHNNAMRVILMDPALTGLVWHDEFLGRELTRYRTGELHEWGEIDSLSLQLYLQDSVHIDRMSVDTVRGAVRLAAERDTRNCVKEYIEHTEWDQHPRIDSMMHDIYHCVDDVYTRAVSRNFWKMMIARIYRPGCKVDNMVVLEGGQGSLKSTSLSIIGGEWFAEQHESATDPRSFAEVLQAKLLIEITEMDAFGRSEVTRIKSAITTQSDRYRIPYESQATDHPRQCVMVGTTNTDDWQRDATGGRRFWPIACEGLADVEKLTRDRDQLFAEALVRFRAGETWHEMPELEALAEQRQRFATDVWHGVIEKWLVGRRNVVLIDVATQCLGMAIREVDQRAKIRISSTMRFLGWTSKQTWLDGRNVNAWNPSGLGDH